MTGLVTTFSKPYTHLLPMAERLTRKRHEPEWSYAYDLVYGFENRWGCGQNCEFTTGMKTMSPSGSVEGVERESKYD